MKTAEQAHIDCRLTFFVAMFFDVYEILQVLNLTCKSDIVLSIAVLNCKERQKVQDALDIAMAEAGRPRL